MKKLLYAVLFFAAGVRLLSGTGIKAEIVLKEANSENKEAAGLKIVKHSDATTDFYYYDSSGKKEKNVLKTIRSAGRINVFYFGRDGKAVKNTWKTIRSDKYYFRANARAAIGSCKIKNTYYVFNEKGRLFKPSKTAIRTVKNKKYFVDSRGKAVKGWRIHGGKLYHAAKSGQIHVSKKIQGITLGRDGKAVNNTNCKLKIILMKTVADITTDDMSKSEKLRACWKYCVKRSRFRYALKYPNLHKKEWYCKTAENMLRTKSGNCYSFACAFAALAKEIGYEPSVICGRVHGSRDGASDGYTRHAWVKIKKKYYDPEAQWKGWHSGIYKRSYYPVSHKDTREVKFKYEK